MIDVLARTDEAGPRKPGEVSYLAHSAFVTSADRAETAWMGRVPRSGHRRHLGLPLIQGVLGAADGSRSARWAEGRAGGGGQETPAQASAYREDAEGPVSRVSLGLFKIAWRSDL